MKKITLIVLLVFAPLFGLAQEIKSLDMELGYWVITVDNSDLIEDMLANIPAQSREEVRSALEKQMEEKSKTNQCVTQETLENFDEQMKNALGKNQECNFKVVESTKKSFFANLICPDSTMSIKMSVVNSKLNNSQITAQEKDQELIVMKTVSKWQSVKCPVD